MTTTRKIQLCTQEEAGANKLWREPWRTRCPRPRRRRVRISSLFEMPFLLLDLSVILGMLLFLFSERHSPSCSPSVPSTHSAARSSPRRPPVSFVLCYSSLVALPPDPLDLLFLLASARSPSRSLDLTHTPCATAP